MLTSERSANGSCVFDIRIPVEMPRNGMTRSTKTAAVLSQVEGIVAGTQQKIDIPGKALPVIQHE